MAYVEEIVYPRLPRCQNGTCNRVQRVQVFYSDGTLKGKFCTHCGPQMFLAVLREENQRDLLRAGGREVPEIPSITGSSEDSFRHANSETCSN